jgi:hypothetical protein
MLLVQLRISTREKEEEGPLNNYKKEEKEENEDNVEAIEEEESGR